MSTVSNEPTTTEGSATPQMNLEPVVAFPSTDDSVPAVASSTSNSGSPRKSPKKSPAPAPPAASTVRIEPLINGTDVNSDSLPTVVSPSKISLGSNSPHSSSPKKHPKKKLTTTAPTTTHATETIKIEDITATKDQSTPAVPNETKPKKKQKEQRPKTAQAKQASNSSETTESATTKANNKSNQPKRGQSAQPAASQTNPPLPVVATAATQVTPSPTAPAGPTRKPLLRFGSANNASNTPSTTARAITSPNATTTSQSSPGRSASSSIPPSIHAPASSKEIIVLKVGSASLSTDDCTLLHLRNICTLVETICTLKQRGYQVILVTSGAVAVGCQRLGWTERPKEVVTKQAIAAIGQSRLMRVYDDLFSAMSQPIAQVLLSKENISKRHHYVNALNTFRELLRLGVVPIVNENDTVAVEELKVGDNDTLSALVASLVQAKWLFLLTDVSGLYDSDPRSNPSAKIVNTVTEISDLNVNLGSSGRIGTGGMTTKLVAATIATAAGVHTGIIKSTELENIQRMMAGEKVGTHFLPCAQPLKPHKKWIAHGLTPEGSLIVDAGAARAIQEKKSLFATGIVGVQGKFKAGASIRLLRATGPATNGPQVTPSPPPPSSPSSPVMTVPIPQRQARIYSSKEISDLVELGVGIVQFSSDEVLKLSGQHSSAFATILGYEVDESEVIHREDIVLTRKNTEKLSSTDPATTNQPNDTKRPTTTTASSTVTTAPPTKQAKTKQVTPTQVQSSPSPTTTTSKQRKQTQSRNGQSSASHSSTTTASTTSQPTSTNGESTSQTVPTPSKPTPTPRTAAANSHQSKKQEKRVNSTKTTQTQSSTPSTATTDSPVTKQPTNTKNKNQNKPRKRATEATNPA